MQHFLEITTVFSSKILETGDVYLDPGSGSFILQLIIAGLMGALFMVGVYWKKVKKFIKGIFISENKDDEIIND